MEHPRKKFIRYQDHPRFGMESLVIGRIAFPMVFLVVFGVVFFIGSTLMLAMGWSYMNLWLALPPTIFWGALTLWGLWIGIKWTIDAFIELNRKELR